MRIGNMPFNHPFADPDTEQAAVFKCLQRPFNLIRRFAAEHTGQHLFHPHLNMRQRQICDRKQCYQSHGYNHQPFYRQTGQKQLHKPNRRHHRRHAVIRLPQQQKTRYTAQSNTYPHARKILIPPLNFKQPCRHHDKRRFQKFRRLNLHADINPAARTFNLNPEKQCQQDQQHGTGISQNGQPAD